MYGVEQEILHTEPTAEIPPVKAQDVVQQQWAQSVELLAHGEVMTASNKAHARQWCWAESAGSPRAPA